VPTARGARFSKRQRERAWWLVGAAAIAAALWALAQVLDWPIAVRAVLASLAAVAALLIPELRARGARADLRQQLLHRLEIPGADGALPRVASVEPSRWRIHAAQAVVPYIPRDKEVDLYDALRTRQPVAVVGHSMAGKTMLAVHGIQELFPDAPLLAALPGKALRDLVEAGLQLNGVVVWLDDLERFLKGDDALNPGLLGRLINGGAIVVATIRRKELSRYRPREESRSPEWDLLSQFRQIPLERSLTEDELEFVHAQVDDAALLAGIKRYGLAEYLGAGPDALGKFDDGETVCPVGFALVRAAVDWRRAGLARLVPRELLGQALPIYLEDRDDVPRDAEAISAGLTWATEKINETVALLVVHSRAEPPDTQMFEAFDYLVDVADERETPIPPAMWRLVAGEASRAETRDIARAAFIGRSDVMAELLAWVGQPDPGGSHLLVVTGSPGTGKSAVLARLVVLTDPALREGAEESTFGRRYFMGSVQVVAVNARFATANEILRAIVSGGGLDQPVESLPYEERLHGLLRAVSDDDRTLTVVVDALDEVVPGEGLKTAHLLTRLATGGMRVVVGTRKQPDLMNALRADRIIDLDSARDAERADVAAYVRQVLMTRPNSPYRGSPETVDRLAVAVADRAGGNFLLGKLAAESLAEGPATDAGRPGWDDALSSRLADWVLVMLERLGPDRPRAEQLLAALAFAQAGLSAEAWLEAARDLGDRELSRLDLERLLASPVAALVSVIGGDQPTYTSLHAAISDVIAALWIEGHPPGEASQT
jgi:hypothetical protein